MSRYLWNIQQIRFRFVLCESIVRISLCSELESDLDMVMQSIDDVIWASDHKTYTEKECSTAGILALVLLVQTRNIEYLKSFASSVVYRCSLVFLQLIRGRPTAVAVSLTSFTQPRLISPTETDTVFLPVGQQEPFSQDVCCVGLCVAYDIAKSIECQADTSSSLASRIASLVIATLCREKKALPAAGIVYILMGLLFDTYNVLFHRLCCSR
jgi:hypothetical protein